MVMDIKKQAEFDRLMAAASTSRMRGDYQQANALIKQALLVNPTDHVAREFAADMIYAHGDIEAAADAYKALLDEDKSLASVEAKYARAILQLAEGERQKALLQEMLENPARFRTPARSPLVAAVLSAAPGFGHIYCGQLVRGVVFFVTTVISWLLFYAFSPPVPPYPDMNARIMQFLKNMDPAAIIFAMVGMFLHIYALVDATVQAGKTRETQEAEDISRSV